MAHLDSLSLSLASLVGIALATVSALGILGALSLVLKSRAKAATVIGLISIFGFLAGLLLLIVSFGAWVTVLINKNQNGLSVILSNPFFLIPALVFGAFLFHIRSRFSFFYGVVEFCFALISIEIAIGSHSDSLLTKCIGLSAGLFILIRSLDHLSKGLPETLRNRLTKRFAPLIGNSKNLSGTLMRWLIFVPEKTENRMMTPATEQDAKMRVAGRRSMAAFESRDWLLHHDVPIPTRHAKAFMVAAEAILAEISEIVGIRRDDIKDRIKESNRWLLGGYEHVEYVMFSDAMSYSDGIVRYG